MIGRGGRTINAIRNLSGAHNEVQSKGQEDRTIFIMGSAEATRLANTWISAIITSPDKNLADIVGKQQYKTLSTVKESQATLIITKTQLVNKAGHTRRIVDQTRPALTMKTKPITSKSFDAIANFGTIPIGPPLASSLKAAPGK